LGVAARARGPPQELLPEGLVHHGQQRVETAMPIVGAV
jgi:hypothetical protein